jgi:ElaA protein
MTTAEVHDGVIADIDPTVLYRLLALRVDVFVVEQACRYRELDGRDLEPGARLVWAEQHDQPVATLRLLIDPDGAVRIGRVATAATARGAGLASSLMRRALGLAATMAPGADAVLDAQTYLVGWYARFGFRRDGADFDEDGISHTPMRRPVDTAPAATEDVHSN